jgi:PleD family two-component response regulator
MDKFIAEKPVDPIMAATRAMVVCEQAYTRRLVADVLYGMGIGAVALFDQPKRALESMAQFRPTLLVANWDAPSQDGLDLAKLVRSAANEPMVWIKTQPERFEPRRVRTEPLDATRVRVVPCQ